MKKIVRLTESELKNIVEKSVKRAIKEGAVNEVNWKKAGKEVGKTLATGAVGGAVAAATLTTDNPVSRGIERQVAQHNKTSRADAETRKEFGKDLKGKNPKDSIPSQKDIQDPKTKAWEERRIRRAVMESIKKLMNGRL